MPHRVRDTDASYCFGAGAVTGVALFFARRLRRGSRRLHRRGLRGEIFCDHRRIERGDLGVGQPLPDLILAEQREPHIAAHGQRLAVRAQRHLRLVDFAVARIEHVAVLVFQSVALHVADEGQSEPGLVLAIVGAFGAERVRVFAGLHKHFGDRALEHDAVAIDHQKPAVRLAVLGLLPQPGGGGTGLHGGGRCGGLRGGGQRRANITTSAAAAAPRTIRTRRVKSLPANFMRLIQILIFATGELHGTHTMSILREEEMGGVCVPRDAAQRVALAKRRAAPGP